MTRRATARLPLIAGAVLSGLAAAPFAPAQTVAEMLSRRGKIILGVGSVSGRRDGQYPAGNEARPDGAGADG